MRIPLYIGIPVDVDVRDALPDATSIRRLSFSDRAYLLRNGDHGAYAIVLGTAAVGGTTYRVAVVIVVDGDQRRVYRWLKSKAAITGPYTRHNAPAPLRTFLASLRSDGVPSSPVVIFGDDIKSYDSVDYAEGADPGGDLDEVVEV